MRNGKYTAELKLYPGTKRRVNVFQGKASVYTMQGVYVCDIPANCVEDHYSHIETAPKPLYNIAWMIQGEIKELVMQNISYALAQHHLKKLKLQERYKGGLLMPVQSQLS